MKNWVIFTSRRGVSAKMASIYEVVTAQAWVRVSSLVDGSGWKWGLSWGREWKAFERPEGNYLLGYRGSRLVNFKGV
jgi:hypothetical protein